MIAITPTAALRSHHRSPIIPDHVRPARSILALPSSTAARAHVGSHHRYPGRSTWSRGHHVTIAQPRVMKAASLAVHLVSGHGLWGFQPPFHAILVSYTLLMSLSGSRTGGSASALIPDSEASCMRPCPLLFVPSSVPFMRTATLVTDTLLSMIRLYTCPGDPVLSGPISSSSAELYFLSSIIISHCIPLARML